MEKENLLDWWKSAGRKDRERLKNAVGVSNPVLNNYIHGRRRPPYEIAKLIADVVGIPVSMIAYRYVNDPREV